LAGISFGKSLARAQNVIPVSGGMVLFPPFLIILKRWFFSVAFVARIVAPFTDCAPKHIGAGFVLLSKQSNKPLSPESKPKNGGQTCQNFGSGYGGGDFAITPKL
jgi:hypothetical protein